MVASFPFTTYFRNQYDGCVVLFHYHETAPIPAIETDVVTLDLEHIDTAKLTTEHLFHLKTLFPNVRNVKLATATNGAAIIEALELVGAVSVRHAAAADDLRRVLGCHLQQLVLSGQTHLGQALRSSGVRMESLQTLNASHCALTDEDVALLVDAFPNLHTLDLSGNTHLSCAAVGRALARLPKLTSLHMLHRVPADMYQTVVEACGDRLVFAQMVFEEPWHIYTLVDGCPMLDGLDAWRSTREIYGDVAGALGVHFDDYYLATDAVQAFQAARGGMTM